MLPMGLSYIISHLGERLVILLAIRCAPCYFLQRVSRIRTCISVQDTHP